MTSCSGITDPERRNCCRSTKPLRYLELYHKGEANAVTSRELECAFRMRGSELRREINALRGDGIPICSFDGGYYYAATEEELRRTIRQLRSGSRKSHLRSAPRLPGSCIAAPSMRLASPPSACASSAVRR